MLRTDFNQLLAHGSVADLAQAAAELGPALPRVDGDTFLKKAEAWAYQAFFLSTRNEVEELLGRFALAPPDALLMAFLESRVAPSNRLPTGHLYEPAMVDAMDALVPLLDGAQAQEAADVLELLDRDLELRGYLLERRLEHFYS